MRIIHRIIEPCGVWLFIQYYPARSYTVIEPCGVWLFIQYYPAQSCRSYTLWCMVIHTLLPCSIMQIIHRYRTLWCMVIHTVLPCSNVHVVYGYSYSIIELFGVWLFSPLNHYLMSKVFHGLFCCSTPGSSLQ